MVNFAQFMMRLVQLPVSPQGGPGPVVSVGDYYDYEGGQTSDTGPVTPTVHHIHVLTLHSSLFQSATGLLF